MDNTMNGSPFAMEKKPKAGPEISPATLQASGRGGQQNPAYLQMRKSTGQTGQTMPVITPSASAPGDTVNLKPQMPPVGQGAAGPSISPPPNTVPSSSPAQAGGNSLGDLYKFFASDLANQTKQAKSNAVANASARGVYYGTPLTGSEADIDTQYLRGMGQLQAGMYGNEQANQLARLGMASNLSAQGSANAPPVPGPIDFSGLGAIFGNTTPANTPRSGPTITPPTPTAGKPPITRSY